jgi:hypothetical protein
MKYIVIVIILFTQNVFGQNNDSELESIKSTLISQALEIGQEYNLILDFSDESIKNVEYILSDLHNSYSSSKNDEGLIGLSFIFGFYIIEVINKNHGVGRLERNHPEFGENSFPFYWKGGILFPIAWCNMRIFDGPDDNIIAKYNILVLEDTGK